MFAWEDWLSLVLSVWIVVFAESSLDCKDSDNWVSLVKADWMVEERVLRAASAERQVVRAGEGGG